MAFCVRIRGMCVALSVAMTVVTAVACAADPPESDHPWKTTDSLVRAMNRGVALMDRYDYAAAVTAFQEAAKLAPKSAEVRVNLAISLYNRNAKGDLERSETILDEVLAGHPDHVRALYFRGIAHQYRGQDDLAITHFARVTELVPHDATAWYLLARSKSRLGKPARADLLHAIRENPSLVSAYYDLMRIAAIAGDQDEARKYRERFLALRESPLAETVVMPQYRKMGPLATVQPLPANRTRSIAGGELSAGKPRTLARRFGAVVRSPSAQRSASMFDQGIAIADVNRDGRLDLAVCIPIENSKSKVVLLLGRPDQSFAIAGLSCGLVVSQPAAACAFGDYDNDGNVDLFVSCTGPNHLFRGRGDGTFEDVTEKTGTAGPNVHSASAIFLDADHDGDLDIYVCNHTHLNDSGQPANQLLNNNSDGTFADIAARAGVACAGDSSMAVAPVDIDGDRDTDLVVFNFNSPVRVFFNDRLGKYHAEPTGTKRAFEKRCQEPSRDRKGAILDTETGSLPYGRGSDEDSNPPSKWIPTQFGCAQDFNGDGHVDVLRLSGSGRSRQLLLSDAGGLLALSPQFDGAVDAVTSWGIICTWRVADIDLDGDLDIALFGDAGHVLLNDGLGHFVARKNVWPEVFTEDIVGIELAELTGDGVPDLLRVSTRDGGTVEVIPTKLTPPANWVAITPTGDRGDDKRTRSPTSGFGTRMELRCGLHSQTITYTGLNGGPCQSQLPVIFGLGGAAKADYLALTWPDGVTQCEIGLQARTHHRISETERRVSSCPVLFAWNGERFGFVADFAGVGGLGYFVAPGEYALPQVLEHVKIEPNQLTAKDGFYELRVCEPMEEVAYVDRLELLAIDHPSTMSVFPDERLAVTGPPATHRLLCIKERIFPVSAMTMFAEQVQEPSRDRKGAILDPDTRSLPYGRGSDKTSYIRSKNNASLDCTEQLLQVDRIYANTPELDRRFYGFCKPHTLELDFSDRLSAIVDSPGVYLFINGWIEYPYSQTTYAAGQAHVEWQPMRIERRSVDGQWETIIPDAGAPGGLGRMITMDLTGLLEPGLCKLRITTNLEIYYDQIFIAADRGTDGLAVRSVPMAEATLRRLGFPVEYSPDGRHPVIYNYDVIEATSSFKIPRGAYTRYGSVDALLTEFDDRFVILGTGDEIALRFDADSIAPLSPGWSRSFVLVSHAYCKDMDLYTGEPDTVEPLPFGGMTMYPYPPSEHYPDGKEYEDYRKQFNTRTAD